MPNLTILKRAKLDVTTQESLLAYLEEMLVLGSSVNKITSDVRENRFSKGKVCPHYKSDSICRNGRYRGKQRYICKLCGRTFSDFTFSPMSNSKIELNKWLQYAKCMVNGYSIRKSAEIVGINIATSFFWRHKLLDAVKAYMGIGFVDGIVEADEIFFRESFKGNHSKSKSFSMPKASRKRGNMATKRGISKEQVCVATAIDRSNNFIVELVCKGRITSKDLNRLYGEHIGSKPILCTDSHKSYVQFTKDLGLEHQKIKRGYHKQGIFHIQHINSFHSRLKKWMSRF